MAIDLNTRLLGGGFDRPLTRIADNWLAADRRSGLGNTPAGSAALGSNRQQAAYDAQGRVLSADTGARRMTDKYRLGYQAHAGDSLERIAETVWSDKSLWYLLAEANDLNLGATDSLGTDQLLKVPFVADSQGGIHVFDTDAVLVADITKPAEIPAPPANKLSWLSILLQVVVTVVVVVAVSALTAGLGTVVAGMIGGAVGAVVGDVVGQTAAMAFNDRLSWDNYDLKRTLIAGAVGAIGGALSSGSTALNAVVADKSLLARMAFVAVKDTTLGAATNSIEQGVRMASGAQDHFDVGQLAASAIAGVVDGGYSIAQDATHVVGSSVSRGLAAAAGDVVWDMSYGFSRNLFGDMMTKGINTGDFSLDLNALETSAAASVGRALGGGIGQRIRAEVQRRDSGVDESWEWVPEARTAALPSNDEQGRAIVAATSSRSGFFDEFPDLEPFVPSVLAMPQAEQLLPKTRAYLDVPANDGVGEVFRADSRAPGQIFKHGFQPDQKDWYAWGLNHDQAASNSPATRSYALAMAQAKKSGTGYLYSIANRSDASMLKRMAREADKARDTLTFPGGISAQEVIGVRQVLNGVVGPLQLNQDFMRSAVTVQALPTELRPHVTGIATHSQSATVQKSLTDYERVQPNDGIGQVFRTDNRGPELIFKQGFQAGQDKELVLSLGKARAADSSLATRSIGQALAQADRSGISYLYSVRNRSDARMLKAMAKPYDPHAESLYFPGGIAAEDIIGVRKVVNGELGPLEINKGFNRSATVPAPYTGSRGVLEAVAATMPKADDERFLFRADSRVPAEIFRDGFRTQGDRRNLQEFYEGVGSSIYVATSKSFDVAHGFARSDQRNYVYVVHEQAHGIDANMTRLAPSDHEQEVTFPGGIGAKSIYGVVVVHGDRIGSLIRNPDYDPE